MNSSISPVPGHWYLDRESGETFQIVSVDEDDRSIDIQYADGSLEGASLEDWTARNLESCEQLEDTAGPFGDLASDDVGMPEPHGADIAMERALLELEERGTGSNE